MANEIIEWLEREYVDADNKVSAELIERMDGTAFHTQISVGELESCKYRKMIAALLAKAREEFGEGS